MIKYIIRKRRLKMEKKKIKTTALLIIGLLIIVIIAANIKPKKEVLIYKEELLNINYDIESNETTLEQYNTTNPIVAMYIKNYGSIVIELYPNIAKNTVNNFISLVKSGFYDDNTFHRLIKDFVLQGGDPNGDGTGGPGYSIEGEFDANKYENKLKHEIGVVSMARSSEYDSAGSQFFIVLDNASHLDGNYAAFGKVIDGWENIEKIISQEKILNESTGKLKQNLTIKKAIVDVKGKTYEEVKKVTK